MDRPPSSSCCFAAAAPGSIPRFYEFSASRTSYMGSTVESPWNLAGDHRSLTLAIHWSKLTSPADGELGYSFRAMKKILSPKQVLAVPCPTCGAKPGEKCELSAGQPRTDPHRDRRLIAKDKT